MRAHHFSRLILATLAGATLFGGAYAATTIPPAATPMTPQAARMIITSKMLVSDVAMNLAHPTADLKASLQFGNNAPAAGRAIAFKVDGKPVGTAMTGPDGRATFNFAPAPAPMSGPHTWSASFDGDYQYSGSSANATLIVNKEAAQIVIDSATISWEQADYAHHVHFTGTLSGFADHNPIKADGLAVSIDGNVVEHVNTDAQGKFSGHAIIGSGNRVLQIAFPDNAKYGPTMEGKTLNVPGEKVYFWFTDGFGWVHDTSPYGFGDLKQPAQFSWYDCDYNKMGDAGTYLLDFATSAKIHVTKDNSPTGKPAANVPVSMIVEGKSSTQGTTNANGDVVMHYTPSGTTVQLKVESSDTTKFTGSGITQKFAVIPQPAVTPCKGGSSVRQFMIPNH